MDYKFQNNKSLPAVQSCNGKVSNGSDDLEHKKELLNDFSSISVDEKDDIFVPEYIVKVVGSRRNPIMEENECEI